MFRDVFYKLTIQREVWCRLKIIHTGEKTYPWVAGVMCFGNSGQCDKLFSHDTKSIIRVGL